MLGPSRAEASIARPATVSRMLVGRNSHNGPSVTAHVSANGCVCKDMVACPCLPPAWTRQATVRGSVGLPTGCRVGRDFHDQFLAWEEATSYDAYQHREGAQPTGWGQAHGAGLDLDMHGSGVAGQRPPSPVAPLVRGPDGAGRMTPTLSGRAHDPVSTDDRPDLHGAADCGLFDPITVLPSWLLVGRRARRPRQGA